MKNRLINITLLIIRTILPLVYIPYFIYHYGYELYGIYVIIYAIINIIGPFETGCLNFLIKEKNENKLSNLQSVAKISIIFVLIISSISFYYIKQYDLDFIIIFNILSIIITRILLIFISANILLIENYINYAILQLIQPLINLISLTISIIFEKEFYVIFEIGLYFNLVFLVSISSIYKINFNLVLNRNYPISKTIKDYIINQVYSYMFSNMDKYIVEYNLGFKQLGIYNNIKTIASYINVASGYYNQPLMTSSNELKDINQFRKHNLSNLLFVSSITIVYYLFGRYIFLYFDLNYDILKNEFFLFIILYLLLSLNNINYYTMIIINKVKLYNKIFAVAAIASLIMIYILSLNYKLIGAILGNYPILIILLSFKITLNYYEKSVKND